MDYRTPESMAAYLRSYQTQGDSSVHQPWAPFAFFCVTLAVNIWVLSRGISGGIEKLARIGMPILFLFAVVLAVSVFLIPTGDNGVGAVQGLELIYAPDFSRIGDASVWLAAAGQIFFTLSVGVGTLQTYASYLSTQDDIALSGLATAAVNESPAGGQVPAGSEWYVHASRLIILAIIVFFLVMVRIAWKRNGYDDRAGFPVVEDTPAGAPVRE